jgi:hypothetical protein
MRGARLPIVGLARKSSWMAADEPPELPPTPQLAVDLNVDGQTSQRDDHCSDHQAYNIDDDLSATSEIAHYAAEEHRQGNEVSQACRGRVCRSGHTDQITASWLQDDEDSVTSKY